MTDTREMTQTAQNQTLDFVRQSQDAFVEAMQVWSDSLNRLVGTTQERTATVSELPKPDEVLDQVFDFAEALLSAQREFAHNVVRTASTVWAQGEQTAAQESQTAPQESQTAPQESQTAPQESQTAPQESQKATSAAVEAMKKAENKKAEK